MASFYLDHDVSHGLLPLLEQRAHAVVTAWGSGRAAAGDEAQLLEAVQAAAILITHNRRDFELLHDAWTTWPAAFDIELPAHPGILVLPHGPVINQVEAIDTLLETETPETLRNQLFIWRPDRGWQRRTSE